MSVCSFLESYCEFGQQRVNISFSESCILYFMDSNSKKVARNIMNVVLERIRFSTAKCANAIAESCSFCTRVCASRANE